MNEKISIITNDVETTSLWNHKLSSKTAEVVLKEGIPTLLELYEKYNIKSTFFFNNDIVKLFPDIVRMIIPYGHEVACHGLTHESDKAFDVLSLNQQIEHLRISKEILEDLSGHEVISFRAPALRVNEDTALALKKTGFKIDSSVAPQRLDMFFSFGSKEKMKWLFAPRKPYFTKTNDLTRKGEGDIFEIPVSSFILPYAGTIMRISPLLHNLIRSFLNLECFFTNRALVFLIHPNELINERIEIVSIQRRAKNYFAYLLGDKLRYTLKLRNLGRKAIPLFENQLKYLSKKNYKFVTAKDYFLMQTYK